MLILWASKKGQNMSETSQFNPEIERDKLKIEYEKIAVENRKLEVELKQSKWTALSVVVSLLAILGTVSYGLWNTYQQAKFAFQAEIAKGIIASQDPEEANAKAQFFIELFPDKLPQIFAKQVDPSRWSNALGWRGRLALFQTIAKGLTADQAITLWRQLFPEDKWATALSVPPPETNQIPKVEQKPQ
jgi:hypothetical protein